MSRIVSRFTKPEPFEVQAPGSFDRNAMTVGQRIYTSPTGSFTERLAGEPGSESGGWSHHESEDDRAARRKRDYEQAAKNFGMTSGQSETLRRARED
jgi:hypothetical protein